MTTPTAAARRLAPGDRLLPVRGPRAARAPGAWARSTAPATRASTARWPSRCCRRSVADDPAVQARFEREARAAATLVAPGHRHHLRVRPRARSPAGGHGAAARRDAARAARPRAHPVDRRAAIAAADGRRAGRRPRRRDRPSRPQARERVPDPQRRRRRSSTSGWRPARPSAAHRRRGRRRPGRTSGAGGSPARSATCAPEQLRGEPRGRPRRPVRARLHPLRAAVTGRRTFPGATPPTSPPRCWPASRRRWPRWAPTCRPSSTPWCSAACASSPPTASIPPPTWPRRCATSGGRRSAASHARRCHRRGPAPPATTHFDLRGHRQRPGRAARRDCRRQGRQAGGDRRPPGRCWAASSLHRGTIPSKTMREVMSIWPACSSAPSTAAIRSRTESLLRRPAVARPAGDRARAAGGATVISSATASCLADGLARVRRPARVARRQRAPRVRRSPPTTCSWPAARRPAHGRRQFPMDGQRIFDTDALPPLRRRSPAS